MKHRCVSGALLLGWACLPALAESLTVADSTVITTFMSDSAMRVTDMNNDCAISDVDYAMMFEERLTEQYGADLTVGDLDGDGSQTGEDVIMAISKIIRASFGKTSDNGQPVSGLDVSIALDKVLDQTADSDINFDGSKDVEDLLVTVSRVGSGVNEYAIDQVARAAFEYIGAIRELGHEQFMSAGCAGFTGHLPFISSSWPLPHPLWWKPNHLSGVSLSYPAHSYGTSYMSPPHPEGTPAHLTMTSELWPPNHLWESSITWPPPPPSPHGTITSIVGGPYPYVHFADVSQGWPAGHAPEVSSAWTHTVSLSDTWPAAHTWAASSTWHHQTVTSAGGHHGESISLLNPNPHDLAISRTWWPHHTAADSHSHTWPPLHLATITGSWGHQVVASQGIWPPNHYPSVSDTWGNHQVNVSFHWPPAHVGDASETWPGPQPTWPPTHVLSNSQGWGTPAPGPWPLFPAGHSWWTTILGSPGIIPQWPWPTPAPP